MKPSSLFRRRSARALAVTASLVLGAAFVVVPVAFAADAGAPLPQNSPAPKKPADAGLVVTKTPPDPSPLSERKQWVFDLRYDKGDLYLLGVHPLDLGAPQVTPRAMGRFAIELFEGPTLIERVRFDFPFLGAGEPTTDAGNRYSAPPKFAESKVTTRIGVMFPATARGTRLELWDRATDQRWPLPWPPDHAAAARADAGATTTDGG